MGGDNIHPLRFIMTNTVISYPIPAYSNPPIQPSFFSPKFFFINEIVLGITTVVTTSVEHDYVIGQSVRLIIPTKFGSRQLNEKEGMVISIPATNMVELNIDSSLNVDPFYLSATPTRAQILAIGDYNTGAINDSGRINQGTYIPGSFRNISPWG